MDFSGVFTYLYKVERGINVDFFTLNFKEQSEDFVAKNLIDILSKRNVTNGKSLV